MKLNFGENVKNKRIKIDSLRKTLGDDDDDFGLPGM